MVQPIDVVLDLLARHEHRLAWGELSRLMMESPTTATCHLVADLAHRVDVAAAGVATTRLAILSNYTAQPLAPLLQGHAVLSGLQLQVHVPAFDTWMQELLDPESELRRFDPHVVVIDLVADAVCPALAREFLRLSLDDVDAIVRQTSDLVETAVQSLSAWSRARVLVHLFEQPVAPTLGILDAGAGSHSHAISTLNLRLRAIATRSGNVSCVDTDRLVAELGYARWRDQRLWLMARIPYTTAAMHRIAAEQLRFIRALTGRARKLLVLDLDDILWGGVLGEVGPDGILLGPSYPGNAFVELQAAILELHRRGVVLALNSSNDADEALRLLDAHPSMLLRSEAFAAVRINWQDKAQNLVELSEELGLGLDACVFVDNSPSECARVRQALPEVLTLQLDGDPAGFAMRIRQLGVFDSLSYTAEDQRRGSFYRSEAQRGALRKTVASTDEYLASLGTELTVEAVGPPTAARAADLTQRTNQFNMTTRRRTRDEILTYIDSSQREAYVFSLNDRFGEQGVIGFATLEAGGDSELRIADFLVSCRVLKRRVETAMLTFLLERSRERGATHLVAEFRPTKRNAPFAGFYTSEGFAPRGEAEHPQFVRSTADAGAVVTHVRLVRRPTESTPA